LPHASVAFAGEKREEGREKREERKEETRGKRM
jgi:hypothetical protein